MKRSEAYQYRRNISAVIADLSDVAALDVIDLFLPWAPDTDYIAGDRRRHGEKLYRCEQSHRSQATWSPDVTPALWTEIFVDEWEPWKQPTGAQDAYRIGARVSHSEKHWINERDYNVSEPGTFDCGWSEAQ